MKRSVIITWVVLLQFWLVVWEVSDCAIRMKPKIKGSNSRGLPEFRSSANFANADLAAVMADLQTAGVQNVAVKETHVRDLSEQGDIGLYSYAEFVADQILS